jgi:hypothetical protein
LTRDTTAVQARSRLSAAGHRFAPLAGPGPVEVVDVADLDSAADDVPAWALARAVGPGGCTRSWAGLPEVLLRLRRRPFVLVIANAADGPGPRVLGVVTSSDLRRPVVGIAVLGLVLRSEPRLDVLIDWWSDGRWAELVPPRRRAKLDALQATVPGDRLPMRVLNLDDRMTLIRKLPALRAALGFHSTATFRRFAEPLCRARDALAHGADLLAAVDDPDEAIALVLRLRQLVDTIDDLLDADGMPPSN